jgi:hypothetical protein
MEKDRYLFIACFWFYACWLFYFFLSALQMMADETFKWYQTLDKTFPIMVLAGFLAQLVDGALGMGYGVTSATILLSSVLIPQLSAEHSYC